MKQSFRIFLLLTHIVLTTSSWAQSAVSELGSKNLDDLKQTADKLVGGSDAAEFTQAAFASKRMDFLELCWATRSCMRVFLEELQEIDDIEFRDRLVLMMLRCPDRRAWLDENGGGLLGGGQDVLASIMQRLIRDHLPDFSSSYERISSLERRRKLADELEVIINHKREDASKPPAAPSLAPQKPVMPALVPP